MVCGVQSSLSLSRCYGCNGGVTVVSGCAACDGGVTLRLSQDVLVVLVVLQLSQDILFVMVVLQSSQNLLVVMMVLQLCLKPIMSDMCLGRNSSITILWSLWERTGQVRSC